MSDVNGPLCSVLCNLDTLLPRLASANETGLITASCRHYHKSKGSFTRTATYPVWMNLTSTCYSSAHCYRTFLPTVHCWPFFFGFEETKITGIRSQTSRRTRLTML